MNVGALRCTWQDSYFDFTNYIFLILGYIIVHDRTLRPVPVFSYNIVQVTIYRRPRIGREGHLDLSEVYDLS